MKKEYYNYGELVTRGRIDYPNCRTYLSNNGFFFYYDEEYEALCAIGSIDYDINIFYDDRFCFEGAKYYKPIDIKNYKDIKFTDKFILSRNDCYMITDYCPLKKDELTIDGIYIDNNDNFLIVENGEPMTNKDVWDRFGLVRPINERYYTYDTNYKENDEFNLNVFDAQSLPNGSIFLSNIGLIWQIIDNNVKLLGSIYFDINDYPEQRYEWFNYDTYYQSYKVLKLGNNE